MPIDAPTAAALDAVRSVARSRRSEAQSRWAAVTAELGIADAALAMHGAGRLTINFHPERPTLTHDRVALGLLETGRYESQWVTGHSNGSRSAIPGGERAAWESRLFNDAYAACAPTEVPFPIYGTFDLLQDPHGGAPRFGSCVIVLDNAVRNRVTMCVGDSHVGPTDLGTFDAPEMILAGLAEQARTNSLLDRALGTHTLIDVLTDGFALTEPSRELNGYIEAQIHGGVDLARDVRAIIADPSFAHTETEADLRAIAARFDVALTWHAGSEIAAVDVTEYKGPDIPPLAVEVAEDGMVHARAIGRAAATERLTPISPAGDAGDGRLQQLKMLWHMVEKFGHDARPA